MSYKPKHNLTEGPITKSLILFALPLLLGNVLQSLNGTINSIWIGHYLGESAFAATSNANNIMFFLLSSIFGIGMASTILVGQSIGAGNTSQAKRVVGSSLLFFTSLSFIICLVGYFFSETILKWMHTPSDSIPYAVSYLKIIFIGIPFMYFYNFITMILRGAGDSKTPFFFLVLCTVLDTGLNPLFIFGWGPVPKMGIAGSAFATLIAQFISLGLLVAYLYKIKHFLRFTKSDSAYLKFDKEIISSLIRKGIPMGLQMVFVSLSGIFFINLINGYGSLQTAAYGAAMQLSNYVSMPAMAIGGAVSSIAAQNVGAGKWDRVHKTTLAGSLVNFGMTGILVILIYIFNKEALSIFLKDPQSIAIGMKINNITLWSFVLFGITFVVSGVVRATGAVMVPLLFAFITLWVLRIPLAYYLGKIYGFDSLWWSFSISFVIGALMSIGYYLFGNWKKAKMMHHSSQENVQK